MNEEEMKRLTDLEATVAAMQKALEPDLKTLCALANVTRDMATNMEARGTEQDALRTVLIGVLRMLAKHPELVAQTAAGIQMAIEGDFAAVQGSKMTDEALQQRADWIHRLLPEPLKSLVKPA